MPGIAAMRTYERAWLPRDLIAGIVLVTLLVPQGMAYAELAGLPAITGLYTTVVCLVAYAFVGPSPVLVLGPGLVARADDRGDDPAARGRRRGAGDRARRDARADGRGDHASAPGSRRLGFVADLLSSPVRTGYLAGPRGRRSSSASCPSCSASRPTPSGLVAEAVAFVQGLGQTNPGRSAIGLLSLAIILASSASAPRAPGILVAVVGRDRAVDRARPRRRTACRVIGVLPQGFPLPTLPERAARRHPAAVRRGGRASRSSRSATRSRRRAASRRAAGYEVDGNQELAGIGVGQPRRRPLLGLPGQHERLADGGGRSSRAPRPS